MSDMLTHGGSGHRDAPAIVRRAEVVREPAETREFSVVEKPLSAFERLYNQAWIRKLIILVLLGRI